MKKATKSEFSTCAQCGMLTLSPSDYHPYAACVMFTHLRQSDKVESNLKAVIEYGMRAERAGISAEQAMRDMRLVKE
jgi:hypothetical protein